MLRFLIMYRLVSSLCQLETRRLPWLMGMLFAVIIVFQYFQPPSGNVLWSLYSAGKASAVGNSSFQDENPSSKPEMIGNMTLWNSSNSTSTHVINERTTNIGMPEVTDNRNGVVSEENGDENKYLGLDENNGANKGPSSGNVEMVNRNSTIFNVSAPEEAKEPKQSFYQKNNTADGHFSVGNVGNRTNSSLPEHIGSSGDRFATTSPAIPSTNSLPNEVSPTSMDTDLRPPFVESNSSLSEKNGTTTSESNKNSGQLQSGHTSSGNNSSRIPKATKGHDTPTSAVITISEMNELLLRSHASYQSMAPKWSSRIDQELLYAKSLIKNTTIIKNDPKLYGPLYRNVSIFKRSYELMEGTLKVYIYREGKKPIFHEPPLKGIYASEGWFMKLMKASKQFVTKNPRKAHLFYLPFSSRMLEMALYVPNSHSRKNLIQYLKNYLDMIAAKHPFWNRTGGADHFLVACHDWALDETNKHMAKCIRALCNADMEGFVLGKDVSLPETLVLSPQNLLRALGGKPPSQRSILAFFAGSMHGYLRPILLQHWENKDPDMKIFGRLPKAKGNKNYIQYMKSSKYCICAKGYEVNSPRVVEAIFYECVPVIISDNFVPPFFEVLNWESFAVFVLERDIPNLKSILLSIPAKRYLLLQMGVKKVQQHFLWHAKPMKYDIFHMILHSIWYNRLHQISS
ncbi:hypothetical protein I3842_08G026000 [Carya illinoinensis]|uniref:Exostosin GT47 domain-containing protein n=1 Tax=Carya illinoinensis TaxID=32201 RepID=A0A922J8D0_CARIL|nr:hypothetical protein I3842_08G026000 [Carya illinoinensis]KAG6698572.1 hypothetical protein I3842_08G026000 [Carya illinoinensis]